MTTETRRHARTPLALTALLLAAPGTPTLRLNGLPFGSRLEVLALGIIATASLAPAVRDFVGRLLSTDVRRSFVKLVLIALILLKLFTFFRFPIGDRFEVCIKSTYNPIAERCEKSFDYLFHSNDGVNGMGDITRADETINFTTTTGDERSLLGASHSTWNLPFQNEFPRFEALWLDRLPFTARIGGFIQSEPGLLLPIEFTGDVRLAFSGSSIESSSYEFRTLLLRRVDSSRAEMVLDYAYTDDGQTEVPEAPPAPRGPYAHLFIANPISASEPANLVLNIRGYAVNLVNDRTVKRIEARSTNDVVSAEVESRPDLADFFKDDKHADGGFRLRLSIPQALKDLPSTVLFAILDDGSEQRLGTVEPPDLQADVIEPSARPETNSILTSDFRAWFTLDDGHPALRASHRIKPSVLARVSFLVVDAAMFVLQLVLLALTVMSAARGGAFTRISLSLTGLVLAGWFLLRMGTVLPILRSVPAPLSSSLIVGAPIWWMSRRQVVFGPYIPVTSVATSAALVLEGMRRFTGLSHAPWWGFMLFRDRPMDWFVFQGYAYQIFVQQSLRAGEGAFYFMPGSRYVIFLTHILFGNNDVLIGILVYAALLASALTFLWRGATDLGAGSRANAILICGTLPILGLSLASLTTQLAIGSASEIFAWTIFLATASTLTRLSTNVRLFWFGTSLGVVVLLRPNYLMVSLCFLLGVLLLTVREKPAAITNLVSVGWLVIGFVIVFSLMLSHNVYYGEAFEFFTIRSDPDQTIFEPVRLLSFFGDSFVREVVWQKLRTFFFWQAPSASGILLASWLSQAVFAVAVADLVRRRTRWAPRAAVLASPFMYVLSSAPFGIMTIPERQTNMATLALAVSAIASLAIERSAAVPRELRLDTVSGS